MGTGFPPSRSPLRRAKEGRKRSCAANIQAGFVHGGAKEMASITVQPEFLLERILTLEIVRVTERAAVSSARLRGRGQEKAADQAAVDAMRRELNKLPIDGTVVI